MYWFSFLELARLLLPEFDVLSLSSSVSKSLLLDFLSFKLFRFDSLDEGDGLLSLPFFVLSFDSEPSLLRLAGGGEDSDEISLSWYLLLYLSSCEFLKS